MSKMITATPRPHAIGRGRSSSDASWNARLVEYAVRFAEEALSPDFLERINAMIEEDFGGVGGVLEYDASCRLIGAGTYLDERWRNAYTDYFHQKNPFAQIVEKRGLRNATADFQQFLPPHSLARTEYFNDFMRPQRVTEAVGMSVGVEGEGRMSISVYRGPQRGGEFDPIELRRLEQLRPFALAAFAMRRIAEHLGAQQETPKNFDDLYRLLVAQRTAREAQNAAVVPTAGSASLRDRFGLTERQLEIALALRAGLSRAEIAERLHLSVETVKTHIRGLLDKTGSPTTRHLIVLLASTK